MKNPPHFVSIMQNNTTDFEIKNELPLSRRDISTEKDSETLCKAFKLHWTDQLQGDSNRFIKHNKELSYIHFNIWICLDTNEGNKYTICNMWGSHSCHYEDYCLL